MRAIRHRSSWGCNCNNRPPQWRFETGTGEVACSIWGPFYYVPRIKRGPKFFHPKFKWIRKIFWGSRYKKLFNRFPELQKLYNYITGNNIKNIFNIREIKKIINEKYIDTISGIIQIKVNSNIFREVNKIAPNVTNINQKNNRNNNIKKIHKK